MKMAPTNENWRASRPGDPVQVKASARREGWLIFFGYVIAIGVLLWQAGVFSP